MNFKKLYLSVFMAGGLFQASAQYLPEILRYSQPEQGATARFKAMGNAQNALGGDVSSISGNPAGLGFFNQSDINIGIDYSNNVNKASYYGTTAQHGVDKFSITQAGAVFHLPTQRNPGNNLSSGWLNFNVGIGYARTNNFNSTLGYTGINSQNSIADFMKYEPSTNVYNDFGWQAGMIDEDANGYNVPMTMLGNTQKSYNYEKGFQSETTLSFGANYSNQFYIGGSLGFSRVNHRVNYLFMENGHFEDLDYIYSQNPNSRFTDPQSAYYNMLQSEYAYDNEYWSNTSGNGVNVKLGMIYKPIQSVQIGLSATSPTWYRLSNDFADYFGITNYLVEGGEDFLEIPKDNTYFDYKYRSPYRINGGVAMLFSQGLISADLEYVDYASMKFSSAERQTDENMNTEISNTLKGNVNVRVGGEYLFSDNFLLRAGFAYNGGPYKDIQSHSQVASAGLGYRIDNVYIDLTYQNLTQKYAINPYILDDANNDPSPVVDVSNNRNNLFLTVGFKF